LATDQSLDDASCLDGSCSPSAQCVPSQKVTVSIYKVLVRPGLKWKHLPPGHALVVWFPWPVCSFSVKWCFIFQTLAYGKIAICMWHSSLPD